MVITKCREESEKGEPTKKTRAAKTKASKKSKKKKSADSDEDEDEDPDAHHTALAPGKDDDDDDDSPDLDGMEELLKLNEVDVKKKPASRKGTDTKRRPAAAGSKSKPPKKKKEDWRLLLCLLFIDFSWFVSGGTPLVCMAGSRSYPLSIRYWRVWWGSEVSWSQSIHLFYAIGWMKPHKNPGC